MGSKAVDEIIKMGIANHLAESKDAFNDKFIEKEIERINPELLQINVEPNTELIAPIAGEILSNPAAYRLFKLPLERQMELRRKKKVHIKY